MNRLSEWFNDPIASLLNKSFFLYESVEPMTLWLIQQHNDLLQPTGDVTFIIQVSKLFNFLTLISYFCRLFKKVFV